MSKAVGLRELRGAECGDSRLGLRPSVVVGVDRFVAGADERAVRHLGLGGDQSLFKGHFLVGPGGRRGPQKGRGEEGEAGGAARLGENPKEE